MSIAAAVALSDDLPNGPPPSTQVYALKAASAVRQRGAMVRGRLPPCLLAFRPAQPPHDGRRAGTPKLTTFPFISALAFLAVWRGSCHARGDGRALSPIALRMEQPAPKIDLTQHKLEDGTIVDTTERYVWRLPLPGLQRSSSSGLG